MRGIYTPVTKIRRQVFTEIAKLAYEKKPLSMIEELVYKIIPGEAPTYRDSIFKERAIIGERLRLALGLPLRPVNLPSAISKDIEKADIAEKYYEAPLVNVISFACDACAEKSYYVTNNCRGCLGHPCTVVCPVKAVHRSKKNGCAKIDLDKCIKCGRCMEACPYSAIVKRERPCAVACGVNAIGSDYLGRAKIDYEKCVSCGMCIVNCPFSAIADKSQIYQLIQAINTGNQVIAAIAPAFVGQFGPLATPDKIKPALQMLGISDVYEVAVGADVGAIEEAYHFMQKVPKQLPFLATSCCPSWSIMAKNTFPELASCISDSLTPMVATARLIKQQHPKAKVVFIGPCSSKKLEASRTRVRSDVDFVVTFEELMGMFVAKEVEFSDLPSTPLTGAATASGRGYAIASGVADAIQKCIQAYYDEDVKIDRAEGLAECRKMLSLAKAGKRNGYLLEGMACPGGCIGGAGTIIPENKAITAVGNFKYSALKTLPDNQLLDLP